MSIRVTLKNIEASWLQEQVRLKNSCHHEIPTLHLKELMNARHPEYTANTQEYLKIAGHPLLETPLTSMVISISSGEFRIVNFFSFLVFWKWVRGAYFLITQDGRFQSPGNWYNKAQCRDFFIFHSDWCNFWSWKVKIV